MKKILALIVVAVAMQAHAEEESDSDLPEWMVDKITPLHSRVSRWVSSTSRGLDGFFGTDDSLRVENQSYLRLSQEFEWRETEDFDTDTSLRFRLDLPTTKERLRLVIDSDPEETQGTLEQQGSQSLRQDQTDRRNSVVGLDRLSSRDKTQNWATKFGAGVKLRFPLDPYVRMTTERLWDVGDGPWQLESYNRLSWFDSDGYSARSRWDFGRPLDEVRHFRFITNFQWQEDVDTLEFSETIELNRRLSRRSAIRYAGVMVGNSSSNPRINNYYLLTQYRRSLHKDILFMDVIPELHFPRDSNFDPRWAFTLRLEMLFTGDIQEPRD